VMINCAAPPLLPPNQALQVGERLRQAVEDWSEDCRVMVVASGGLSHWPPIPKVDSVRPEDQPMVDLMIHGRLRQAAAETYRVQRVEAAVPAIGTAVNAEWDRQFLEHLVAGRYRDAFQWTTEEIEALAGNGGQEVRTWAVLAGIANGRPLEVLGYEPVPEWITGMAVVAGRWE